MLQMIPRRDAQDKVEIRQPEIRVEHDYALAGLPKKEGEIRTEVGLANASLATRNGYRARGVARRYES